MKHVGEVLLTVGAILLFGAVFVAIGIERSAEAGRLRHRPHPVVSSAAADAGVADSGYGSDVSVLLDGTDERISTADNANLTCPTLQTVSIWVNASAFQSSDVVAGKYAGSTTKEWAIIHDTVAGEYRFIIGTAATNYCRSTTLGHSTGTWYHLCYNYNGGGADNAARLQAYANGSAISCTYNGTIPASQTDTSALLAVGATSNAANYLSGYVDEFAMWCSTVSCSTLYNAGHVADLTSLSPLVSWRMGEGSTHPTIVNTANPGTYNGTMDNGEAGDITTASHAP